MVENFIGAADLVTMSRWFEGKNFPHTASDSAAERKVDEAAESLQTSLGDVLDRIAEIQSSGSRSIV